MKFYAHELPDKEKSHTPTLVKTPIVRLELRSINAFVAQTIFKVFSFEQQWTALWPLPDSNWLQK